MFHLSKRISFTGVLRNLSCVVLSFVFAITAHAAGSDITIGSNSISASANVSGATSIELRVAGPNDYYAAQSSDTGSTTWDAPYGLADGAYRYEVFVTVGVVSTEEGSADDSQLYRESGRFEVQGGSLSSSPANVGSGASLDTDKEPSLVAQMAKAILDFLVPEAHAADITITDTSPVLIYNDTDVGDTYDWGWYAQGGLGTTAFMELVDSNEGTTTIPIFISSGDNNDDSLYVDGLGDIGLANNSVFIDKSANRMGIGTITPTRNLHIYDSAPAVILEDTAGVTWTLNRNANSSEFDITSTSGLTTRVPFYISSLTPSNSLYMSSLGRIGMGTSVPGAALHVERATDAQILVRNSSATAAERVLFKLVNKGKTRFEIAQIGGASWTFDNDGSFFNVSQVGTGLNEFRVSASGNGYFRGNSYALSHVNTSSRAAKTDFKDLDEHDVLTKLVSLPVTEWRYKQDGSRHFGPVAEEFQQVFGLGDGKTISTVDTAGVTMAAVQGLYKVVQDKDAELSKLKEENSSLAERLKVLEDLILTREVASLSSY